MFELLPKEIGIVLLDLPGYGQSIKPAKSTMDYSKRAIGADLYAALTQLLPMGQKIVLVGHDRGARVIHHMTVHAPFNGPLEIVGIVLCDIIPTTKQWYTIECDKAHDKGIIEVWCPRGCRHVSLVLSRGSPSYPGNSDPCRL